MAKNLSIRFSASASAASIDERPSSVSSNHPTTSETSVNSSADEISSVRLFASGDEDNLDSHFNNNESEDIVNDSLKCDTERLLEDPQNLVNDTFPASSTDSKTGSLKSNNNKNNFAVVKDKIVRHLQDSLTASTGSTSPRQEGPTTTNTINSWYKYAKSDDQLEIIPATGNQAESDDSPSESNQMPISVTPATSATITTTTTIAAAVVKASTSTTSTSTSSWLSDNMKLYNSFRDKWRNEKKCSEDNSGGGDCNAGSDRKSTGNQSTKSVSVTATTKSNSATTTTTTTTGLLPCADQVTLSNHNTDLTYNNRVHRNTCGSCFSRGNQNNAPEQATTLPTPHQQNQQNQPPSSLLYSRETDANWTTSAHRTPTPPSLLLSPSEVVFDPNSDPYLNCENPMIFSFRRNSDGKEKKEKKEKEVKESKKSKLFQGSHSSQTKDKDASLRKKSKEQKEKEKDPMTFIKNFSTRSSSITSSNSLLSPSANNNSSTSLSSFLSIISVSSTKSSSPTQSRSSSTENIEADIDSNSNHITTIGSTAKSSVDTKNFSKNNKLQSSKSMISFKKLKNESEEAVTNLDDTFTSMMVNTTNVSQGNPTLRRKMEALRRDSPTNDFSFFAEDGLSVSSKSSSSDHSLSQSVLTDSHVTPEARGTQSVFSSLHSGVFSWAMCFSYAYYIFALVVALLSLLISLISPLPAFLNGFVLGIMCTFLLVTVVIIYTFSNYVFVKSPEEHRPFCSDSVSLKRSKSKKLSINGLLNIDSGAFSGWVYEYIGEYEQREKNGFASRLVFLVLYGSKLHVMTPLQELNEKKLKHFMTENKMPNFASQRVIDFSKQKNSKRISLFLTKNVRNQRKYIWSKKYPICLEFCDDRSINGGAYLVNGRSDSPDQNERAKTPTVLTSTLKLVIFARTCREKEEWFWAIKNTMDTSTSPKSSELSLAEINSGETINMSDLSIDNDFLNTSQPHYLRILTKRFNYHTFMKANVLSAEGIGLNSPGMMTPLTWFNILLNRLSFDILNKPNWSAYIAKKLQRKLRKLRLPYFMESLTITEIDIGSTLPKFNSVPSVPVVDEAGLWIDFDVNYSGGFTMTLETKLNLMKLKTRESSSVDNIQMSFSNLNASESGFSTPVNTVESPLLSPVTNPKQQVHWRGYKYRATGTTFNANANDFNDEFVVDSESDLDSILTSSEDEEPESAPADPDDADTDEKQRKVIRIVDKIASSQYFQKATQINFLKKAIEGFSKMSIMLTVQINSLNGILAINIPESPSDRLWYGFRNEPNIQITARPKVGDHDLNLHYVTNFIEKKLRAEFFNYFVIPHMDDFFIPALNTNIEQYINVVS